MTGSYVCRSLLKHPCADTGLCSLFSAFSTKTVWSKRCCLARTSLFRNWIEGSCRRGHLERSWNCSNFSVSGQFVQQWSGLFFANTDWIVVPDKAVCFFALGMWFSPAAALCSEIQPSCWFLESVVPIRCERSSINAPILADVTSDCIPSCQSAKAQALRIRASPLMIPS